MIVMDGNDAADPDGISEFLSTYDHDRRQGTPRTITQYKRLFPEIETAIERYCSEDAHAGGHAGFLNTSMVVRRAAAGDATSLEWTIAHFTPFLEAQIRYRLPKGSRDGQVEDLVHEAWLVTLNKFDQLEEKGGRLTPVLVKFLSGIVLNLCRRHFEKRSRPSRIGRIPDLSADDEAESDGFDRQPVAHLGPPEHAMRGETVRFVTAAIRMLHADKREAVVLRLIEQRSNEEAAKIAGVSPNTLAVRYHRALRELRDVVPATLLDDLVSGEA